MKSKPIFPGMIFTAVTLSISPWFMREPQHGSAPRPAAARAANGPRLALRRPTAAPKPKADEAPSFAADPCRFGYLVTPSGAPCPPPDASETAFLDRQAGSSSAPAQPPATDSPRGESAGVPSAPAPDPAASASAAAAPAAAASPAPGDSADAAAQIAAASQQPLEVVQSLRESGLGWDEVAQSLGVAPGTWRPGLRSGGLPLAALNSRTAPLPPPGLSASAAVTQSQTGSPAPSDPQAPPPPQQQVPSAPPSGPPPPSQISQTPPAPPPQQAPASPPPPAAPPQPQAPARPPPIAQTPPAPPTPPDIGGHHGHHPPGQDGDQGRLEQHGGQQGVHGR